MKLKSIFILTFIVLKLNVSAQIDFKNLNLNTILGKAMSVKKGFAPKFNLGNQPLNKIMNVAKIIGVKNNTNATKLFNTFKTGRSVYRVAQYAGSALAIYGVVKSVDKAAIKKDYQPLIKGAIISSLTGLVTKFLTKQASYKAVDLFNGAVKKKLKDILSVAPATNNVGVGLFVNLSKK